MLLRVKSSLIARGNCVEQNVTQLIVLTRLPFSARYRVFFRHFCNTNINSICWNCEQYYFIDYLRLIIIPNRCVTFNNIWHNNRHINSILGLFNLTQHFFFRSFGMTKRMRQRPHSMNTHAFRQHYIVLSQYEGLGHLHMPLLTMKMTIFWKLQY